MGTILEHLQTQRVNVAVVNQANATQVTYVVDTTLAVIGLADSIIPPATTSQHLAHTEPSRLVAAYL